jgi:hypothetical protein
MSKRTIDSLFILERELLPNIDRSAGVFAAARVLATKAEGREPAPWDATRGEEV